MIGANNYISLTELSGYWAHNPTAVRFLTFPDDGPISQFFLRHTFYLIDLNADLWMDQSVEENDGKGTPAFRAGCR
jgi:hypothetical protein